MFISLIFKQKLCVLSLQPGLLAYLFYNDIYKYLNIKNQYSRTIITNSYTYLRHIIIVKFKKILIKSKIYRIFYNKTKTVITPHINFFHIIRVKMFFTFAWSFKKKILLFGLNSQIINNVIINLFFYKRLNVYTQRGFKLSRFTSFKKTGKVVKYF